MFESIASMMQESSSVAHWSAIEGVQSSAFESEYLENELAFFAVSGLEATCLGGGVIQKLHAFFGACRFS